MLVTIIGHTPIWKGITNQTCELFSDEQIPFDVTVDDVAVYSGISVGTVNDTTPVKYTHNIDVTQIVADCMQRDIPLETAAIIDGQRLYYNLVTVKNTRIVRLIYADYTDTFYCVPDWSYEDINYNHVFGPMSQGEGIDDAKRLCEAVIEPLLDIRQYLIHSSLSFTNQNNQLLPYYHTADGEDVFAFGRVLGIDSAEKISRDIEQKGLTDVESVDLIYKPRSHTEEYRLIRPLRETGARYVLHFINAFGMWDSLLILGNAKEFCTPTRSSFTRIQRAAGAATTRQPDRGIVDYRVEVQRKWELHTHFLTDRQSANMHHLLNSPCVYLYDMEQERLTPVVIRTEQTETQTYRNNGHKLISYTISVESAQKEQR